MEFLSDLSFCYLDLIGAAVSGKDATVSETDQIFQYFSVLISALAILNGAFTFYLNNDYIYK